MVDVALAMVHGSCVHNQVTRKSWWQTKETNIGPLMKFVAFVPLLHLILQDWGKHAVTSDDTHATQSMYLKVLP